MSDITDLDVFMRWQKSPRAFIRDAWHITPEPDNSKFRIGQHITWQQDKVLQAIEDAVAGIASKRISVSSGHGIGKSTLLAWVILWYLICFLDAQVPCTAPSSNQMDDVLWKELNKWIDKMPDALKVKLEWTSGYVRVTERPQTWFARARTARPEKPEAFAGVHGDHVLYVADEASGIADVIFNTLEGALTGPSVLLIMTSNPTRTQGYFYDSHHRDKDSWQTFEFDSRESPIVDEKYVRRIIEKDGEDSDEFRIRVRGKFPRTDSIDQKGYSPLFKEEWIHTTNDATMSMNKRLGHDPAGQGSDKATWASRDQYKARILGSEAKSTPKGLAQKTGTLMEAESISADEVYVDSFGIGGDTVKELALDRKDVRGVNVGEQAQDASRYVNIRAEMYWRWREWCIAGGEIVAHPELKKEMLSIRFKRNLGGKIQIMSKEEMRKEGLPSPNYADAVALTFIDGDILGEVVQEDYKAEDYL